MKHQVHHEVDVDEAEVRSWLSGTLIQKAMPDLSKEAREILISGQCDESFHELFPPEPEDEEEK